ncbi:4'-phosphopantetheinyl transferase superfamily protein [Streptomyces iconiensis]|uniref:4'-phosphopantetheinyl transferase superfamily protein n=1 Tax=Streptomyces iconiensis TaxID=1384038 RepID=A0ABT6ZPF7_9ACTN|nr:4'-phosphopantetheinyl transferase superfamily protein [Streptomyces iconiensis]MDJ1130689.1 4'-phosphopantetheinyl transferase superfamily protein [Streptomyces iconiensis]
MAHEVFTDVPEVALFPEEKTAVRRSVEARCREFRTGRHCARQALAHMGIPGLPVPAGPGGAPVWPENIRGSITHCLGYRAAAVARAGDLASLGIDAEPHRHLPDSVLRAVALPEERRRTEELLHGFPDVCWGRLLFSAKESVYKTWYPLAQQPLRYREVSLRIDPVNGTFTARVDARNAGGTRKGPRELTGRWIAEGGLLVTATGLPAMAEASA